jgi:hypothetical protein
MKYQGQPFSNRTVELDGNEYDGCDFQNCTMIYRGGEIPSFTNCSFGSPNFIFEDSAQNVLVFLQLLYHGGFQSFIEATFDNIRAKP